MPPSRLRLWPLQGGIDILYETPAGDLVLSPETREVIGVEAVSRGKAISIKARWGVVLACGGFEFDFGIGLDIGNYFFRHLRCRVGAFIKE